MKNWDRPTLLVSRCLVEEKCRYDGQNAIDKYIKQLDNFADLISVCPEIGIGLGVPRDTIRLVGSDEKDSRLLQASSRIDLTDEMSKFSCNFLKNLEGIDGVILKTKSPSCGINGIKIYKDTEKGRSISKKGKGIFAKEAMNCLTGLPFEDEGRLTNLRVREHFLTRIYMLTELRRVTNRLDLQELREFNSRNTMLLRVYSLHAHKILNGIVDHSEMLSTDKIFEVYNYWVKSAIAKMPRMTSIASAIEKCALHFLDGISKDEEDFIAQCITKFKEGKTPLSVPIALIKANAIRFENKFLLGQTFLEPFPEELNSVKDSSKIL